MEAMESLEDIFGPQDPRYIIFSNEDKRKLFTSEAAAFIGAVAFVQPDVLVYLDKSARPVSWLVNSVLKASFPDNKRPETKYINIGREKVLPFGDPSQSPPSIEPSPDVVERVRQVYANNDGSELDDKRIWLVDEFTATGASLVAAKALLTAAIGDRLPEPIVTRTVFSVEPVWYQNKWMIGVEDVDEQSFLSRNVGFGEDSHPRNSYQLRGELQSIAADILEQY